MGRSWGSHCRDCCRGYGVNAAQAGPFIVPWPPSECDPTSNIFVEGDSPQGTIEPSFHVGPDLRVPQQPNRLPGVGHNDGRARAGDDS